MDEIKNINLYELLDISPTADQSEVKKAYRKKALTCHPDKNPDNPNAVKLFHQLSKALELLLDEAARAAYDRVLKGKEAAKVRNRELDDERKRFKQKLEEQELLAEQGGSFKSAEEKLQKEIDRLRKEGSRQAEEEAARVRQLLLQQLQDSYSSNCRIKATWKAEKGDQQNGGYNEDYLRQIFSPYGKIQALIISSKKNGSALIELSTPEAAERSKLLVTGLPSNPLKLKIIGAANEAARKQQHQSMINNIENPKQSNGPSLFPCFTAAQSTVFTQESSSIDDFEAEVLQRLKRAQERKNLLQKLENEKEAAS